MNTKPNDSAYPESYVGDQMPHEGIGGGLTKREAFAMAAMPGLIAQAHDRYFDARVAVAMADALIAALNEVKE